MKKKEIRVRCWIAIEGEKFFGPGPAELLQLIGDKGSIAKAAKAMGMSYKKGWDIIDHLNEKGQRPYVLSHKGGKKAGGAELTEVRKSVVDEYGRLIATINATVAKNIQILRLI